MTMIATDLLVLFVLVRLCDVVSPPKEGLELGMLQPVGKKPVALGRIDAALKAGIATRFTIRSYHSRVSS